MLLRKKEEIEAWLNQYNIRNYELIEDEKYGYIVNVNKDVILYQKNLKSIEVKFNKIEGFFSCDSNKLTSLEGCPEIVNGNFNCQDNQLESLEGCPKIVNGYFLCSANQLKTLKGCQNVIVGYFYCYDNNIDIEELKYLPKKINNDYIEIYSNNKLGKLQNIRSFKELKEKVEEIFKIKKEKENLLNIINKEDINNKCKNINKI